MTHWRMPMDMNDVWLSLFQASQAASMISS
jgi:hypothetical protein